MIPTPWRNQHSTRHYTNLKKWKNHANAKQIDKPSPRSDVFVFTEIVRTLTICWDRFSFQNRASDSDETVLCMENKWKAGIRLLLLLRFVVRVPKGLLGRRHLLQHLARTSGANRRHCAGPRLLHNLHQPTYARINPLVVQGVASPERIYVFSNLYIYFPKKNTYISLHGRWILSKPSASRTSGSVRI